MDGFINQFISITSAIGLDFSFLTSGYEVDMWLNGMLTTLILVVITIPISLIFGIIFAACLTSQKTWLAEPIRAYIELTRNTPTLVQLMCSFLVLNMLITNLVGGAQNNPFSAFFWVVTVTGLHIAAFNAEALRAGIEAVPATTKEAAHAMGFSNFYVLRYIEVPLAIRIALPSLINNIVNLVKLTTVGSTIAVNEITYASIMIWTQHDNVVTLMIVILLFFWIINSIISYIGAKLEKRLSVPGFGL